MQNAPPCMGRVFRAASSPHDIVTKMDVRMLERCDGNELERNQAREVFEGVVRFAIYQRRRSCSTHNERCNHQGEMVNQSFTEKRCIEVSARLNGDGISSKISLQLFE